MAPQILTAQSLFWQDINQGTASSEPWSFVNMNGTGYFRASTGTSPGRLYRSDGTASGTVMLKDIFADGIVEIGGTLYFYGAAKSDGLWKSNGTAQGTVQVKSGIVPSNITRSGNTIFFFHQFYRKSIGGFIHELWKTNGNSSGTVMVKATNWAAPLWDANGLLLFREQNAAQGSELWRSDGTAAGTYLVKDINPGPAGSLYNATMLWNGFTTGFQTWHRYMSYNGAGAFYFGANDGSTGNQLWKSDGTAVGTVRITSGGPAGKFDPHWLCQIGGKAYFSANDGEHGFELWVLDLTSDSYAMVCDLNPGTAGSCPLWLTAVGSMLYFTADNGTDGRELWKYDGVNPPAMVADINPNAGSSNPYGIRTPPNYNFSPFIAVRNGVLYFPADDGVHGVELWKSDGTSAGTVMVADINPTGSSNPWGMTVVGDKLFFNAGNGTNGIELYVLNGLPKNPASPGREAAVPVELTLGQNYPNPFNPSTVIEYSLPEAARVSLRVFDMLGREVRMLVDDVQDAGRHSLRFDAVDLPSGWYVYRIDAGGKVISRSMQLIR